jgi:hypothetical protein
VSERAPVRTRRDRLKRTRRDERGADVPFERDATLSSALDVADQSKVGARLHSIAVLAQQPEIRERGVVRQRERNAMIDHASEDVRAAVLASSARSRSNARLDPKPVSTRRKKLSASLS